MRKCLPVAAIWFARLHMVHTGDLQVHATRGHYLEPIEFGQLLRRPIVKLAKRIAVDGKFEFVRAESDGQFELFVDEKRQHSVAFLADEPDGADWEEGE